MDIFVHPDNLELLKKHIEAGKYDSPSNRLSMDPFSFTVRTNPHIDRTEPTGRFILPSGEVVDRHNVIVKGRFVTYGPEDIECLLFAGVIREEHAIKVVMIRPSLFKLAFFDMPTRTPMFVKYGVTT